ncbi:MFS transporter [Nonomuraea spiralis]|uniref:MFS transporter n=1 Tax=Nonomuraea spiralis TaxID=46182 RepID=UPI0037AFC5E8
MHRNICGPHWRSRGSCDCAASGIGPILGGLLTEQLGWRSTFLVNLPVSVAAVALTLRVVDESRNPDARRIDLPASRCSPPRRARWSTR